MNSKTILLSVICYATISITGCQVLNNDHSIKNNSKASSAKEVTWQNSGEMFQEPIDSTLAADESRVIFFRNANGGHQSGNVNIGVGRDNIFQVSLQNGHYSENIMCKGDQIINVGTLDKESGKRIFISKNYQFTPKTTTYLQVALSATGSPVIQQVPADEALVLLNKSTRQTHQISRFLSDCTSPTSALIQQPIAASTVNKPIEIKNPSQFNVMFDFDSAGVSSGHSAMLDGMAKFIQSYPKMAVILEGHTDNKGSKNYNLTLSQSRADAVKNVLIDQYGIEAIRLNTLGYGETMPIDTNNTEQGRQNNRRVVAVINKENNS